MGNYLGKKNKNPNLIDESSDQPNVQQFDVSRCKKPTVYRPQIFIDYYKSKLFKVSFWCNIRSYRRTRKVYMTLG